MIKTDEKVSGNLLGNQNQKKQFILPEKEGADMNLRKIYVYRVVVIVLTVLLMGVIFSLSADSAEASDAKSEVISDSVISRILSSFSLDDRQIEKVTTVTVLIVRKTAHFCEYAALGGSLCLCCQSFYKRNRFSFAVSQIVGSLYAVSDELHQYFVPGRSCQISDMLLDSFGVAAGIMAVLLVFRIIDKKRKAVRS